MVWEPPGPSGPQNPPPWPGAPTPDGDPFTRAEHDTRAAIADPWWTTAPPAHRAQALQPRLLALPDHSWWMYGAWARWYRLHPADTRWFPCPPPHPTTTRHAALPPGPGLPPPPVPPHLLPTGPDFAIDYGPPLAVAGKAVSGALAYRLRSVLTQAALAPPADYPLGWNHFLHGTPSTIAATWNTMLWCAAVPAFDPTLATTLLELWTPHLARPPADQGRLRWLPPPPLRTLIGLYTERLRAGRDDAAGQIIRCMVMTAQALRDDPRFRVRAAALLSIIEPIQTGPALDHHALGYGDQAVEREWTSRCPPTLGAALFPDTAPGERLQLACYDLATALTPLCGQPEDDDATEPRHAAIALLAADLAGYRPDLAPPIGDWLDPELRTLLGEITTDTAHPLRALWPAHGRPAEHLTPGTPQTALEILSAAAAADFAWARLGDGVPVPDDGFPVPDAYAHALDELQATTRPLTTETPALPAADPGPDTPHPEALSSTPGA
ncbi:hypothetical protein DPM19_16975 [Actinomadura craniellae]|uniref:Uncharacterized protein n=1 Tax=Actinomadura craniellae TaxID=2231787 RepID=A0A365H4R0_9ACTN|nr:hypothetical protein [Actinomadura craniellae]RAY13982.1 hypothetical protein DPM19_16975 [Actinomadura craniellae]